MSNICLFQLLRICWFSDQRMVKIIFRCSSEGVTWKSNNFFSNQKSLTANGNKQTLLHHDHKSSVCVCVCMIGGNEQEWRFPAFMGSASAAIPLPISTAVRCLCGIFHRILAVRTPHCGPPCTSGLFIVAWLISGNTRSHLHLFYWWALLWWPQLACPLHNRTQALCACVSLT